MPVNSTETCPCCGSSHSVKSKMLMIDAAWIKQTNSDPREAHFASVRVDDVNHEFLKPAPLQQFIEGFYCSKCDVGFIPDNYEKIDARYYYLRKNYSDHSNS